MEWRGTQMSLPQKNGNDPVDDAKPLVFAVDDEPMLLELVALVLEPLGYRVRTFRDPATAVRAFSLAKPQPAVVIDRKSTRLNSSHSQISYAVFCLKKKNLIILS